MLAGKKYFSPDAVHKKRPMARLSAALPALAWTGISLLATSQALTQSPVPADELVRQSHFIFAGRVGKTAASNLKILPASERTMVVRVISVLHVEAGMMDFTGQDVTVQSRRSNSLQPGEQAIFFTDVWLSGEHLAVVENGAMPLTALDGMRKAVPAAKAQIKDAALRARLHDAAIVVAGHAVSVKPVQNAADGPRSEHDPEWWTAEIAPDSVLKGAVPGRHLTVVFPHSDDVMWFRAPKFHRGDSGIWMLHEGTRPAGMEAIPGAIYWSLDPLDFQKSSSLQRVRAFIRAGH